MQKKPLAVLGVLIAFLIASVAIFATVPLVAEEPQLSPPSAEEQEFSSMLEWILSHPKGQELLEGLSQEIIDKLAVEPMPPLREPQAIVNIISQTDLTDVEFETLLEEKGIVLGGLDLRILTEEEAREIELPFERERCKPTGAEMAKAKSIAEAKRTVKIDELFGNWDKNLLPVDNMDWDLPEENGFAVEKIEAIKAVQNYFDGKEDYSTDLNGDGYTSKPEAITWIQNYFNGKPGSYHDIWLGLGYDVDELD